MHTHQSVIKQWPPVDGLMLNHPAASLARKLLGFYLIHVHSDGLTVGKIVETEAYLGIDDAAAHSFRGPTDRTRAMFGPAGHAYIYLSYGVHYCLNVTAGIIGTGEGVLIRALEPIDGQRIMEQRRGMVEMSLSLQSRLTNGPGKLVQAMGITKELYGHNLTQLPLYLSYGAIGDEQVMIGPRVGISKAKDLPLRYWIKHNQFVSKPI